MMKPHADIVKYIAFPGLRYRGCQRNLHRYLASLKEIDNDLNTELWAAIGHITLVLGVITYSQGHMTVDLTNCAM